MIISTTTLLEVEEATFDRHEAEKALAKAISSQAKAMRRAHKAGHSLREIAPYTDLSYATVSRMIEEG